MKNVFCFWPHEKKAIACSNALERPGSFELVSKITWPHLGIAKDVAFFSWSLDFLILLGQAKRISSKDKKI